MIMNAEQLRTLQPALESFVNDFKVCFKRETTFEHFRCYTLGLMADIKRKSVEPIALAAGVPVRTLQEFLSLLSWDHQRMDRLLTQKVADRPGSGKGIAVLDASAHSKRGDKTPGVQRQWCGETGKIDNCIVGQHLLYTDNHRHNPFCCMLRSDLFLPESWDQDRQRCEEAGIPPNVRHRTKWRIATDQLRDVIASGLRLEYVVFDEDYGRIPAFWFELDQMGQIGVGEVPSNFHCWTRRPACTSVQKCHASREARNLVPFSPVFRDQEWNRFKVKDATRGPCVWEYKAARVHLPDREGALSEPTDRMYWLVALRNPASGEIKYMVSNAPEGADPEELIQALFARWHVEKWLERAKQEVGLGAFEVRTYVSLIRHWMCCRIAMCFLAQQTTRLRGEKSAHHVRAGRDGGEHDHGEDLAEELALLV
jgi:SRSO17 transposase